MVVVDLNQLHLADRHLHGLPTQRSVAQKGFRVQDLGFKGLGFRV